MNSLPSTPTPLRLKRLAAVLLLCAAFLPLSRCSSGDTVPPTVHWSLSQQVLPRDDTQAKYVYAFDRVEWSWSGVVTVLAFAWPLPFVLLRSWRRPRRFPLLVNALETLLCVGTLYWLYVLTAFGEYLYGTYVVLISMLLYAAAALSPLLSRLRFLFRRSLSPAPAT